MNYYFVSYILDSWIWRLETTSSIAHYNNILKYMYLIHEILINNI